MSKAEDLFFEQMKAGDLPIPEREIQLITGRKWRCDFVWPSYELAVEIEGGQWVGGRHHRPAGFEADAEKYNQVAMAGYCLFRFTPSMIRSGLAEASVREYFHRWHRLEELEKEDLLSASS